MMSLQDFFARFLPFRAVQNQKQRESESGPPLLADYLILPSYDYVTRKTSEWLNEWSGARIVLVKDSAAHAGLVDILSKNEPTRVLSLCFVGHGFDDGLLTSSELGAYSYGSEGAHGVLCETEHLVASQVPVRIAAWSCRSARIFGRAVGGRPDCSFLGFSESIKVVINDPGCEDLWSGLIKRYLGIVGTRSGVDAEEEARRLLLEERRMIKSGEQDLGQYNRITCMFLKRMARSVVAYDGSAATEPTN